MTTSKQNGRPAAIDPRRLRTIDQAAEELPWTSAHALRHLQRRAPDLGLDRVFVRVGGRVLVDVDKLGEHLAAGRGAAW